MAVEREEIVVERLMFGQAGGDDINFDEGDITKITYPTAERNCWTFHHRNGGMIMIGAGATIYARAITYTEEQEIPEPKES